MFGLFQQKTLDREKCVENVALALIDVFADDSALNFEKFNKIYSFSSRIEKDSGVEKRFFQKKLELITSVAHTVLSRQDLDEVIKPVSEHTLLLMKDVLQTSPSHTVDQLYAEAKRLAELRFSASAREAGKLIENDFTNFVFKFQPDERDIDSQYLVYKQLSGLERSTIFRIGTAIRNSKV